MTGADPEKKKVLVCGEALACALLTGAREKGDTGLLLSPPQEVETPSELRDHFFGIGAEKRKERNAAPAAVKQKNKPRAPKKLGETRLKLPAKNKTPFFGF